jgi:hypothetical protein
LRPEKCEQSSTRQAAGLSDEQARCFSCFEMIWMRPACGPAQGLPCRRSPDRGRWITCIHQQDAATGKKTPQDVTAKLSKLSWRCKRPNWKAAVHVALKMIKCQQRERELGFGAGTQAKKTHHCSGVVKLSTFLSLQPTWEGLWSRGNARWRPAFNCVDETPFGSSQHALPRCAQQRQCVPWINPK